MYFKIFQLHFLINSQKSQTTTTTLLKKNYQTRTYPQRKATQIKFLKSLLENLFEAYMRQVTY